MQNTSDSLDLREVGASIRRGALWIVAGATTGLLVGAAALTLLPPEYEASATVLLRSQMGGGSSSSALSELSGIFGKVPGMGLAGSILATEEQVLTSRAVLGEVVDSLGLQLYVEEPRGVRVEALFAAVRIDPDAEGGTYRFEQRDGGFAVEGPGISRTISPGETLMIRGGELVLRGGELPEAFEVTVLDRHGAILRVEKRLGSEVSGGEVVELAFRAPDPALAAAVPNTMIAKYLQRRRTTDRGVNQHRYEFLLGHTDSIAAQLARAEGALRVYREESGVLDPKLAGEAGLERVMGIREELETAGVEARALRSIIAKGGEGRLSARELAAYPTFLRNPAINELLSSLLKHETQRITLLERRTELDPEVVQLTQNVEHLEGQLVTLARDYLGGLGRQEAELTRELGAYQAVMSGLPRHAEESFRREREVKRLSETLIALQTQLVEARLAAIGEGGDIRQIDSAVPPRKPVFPSRVLTLAGGLLGGLFFGLVAAVGAGRARQEIHEPWEVELGTGVPALWFNPRLPLWFSGMGGARTVLLLPVGRSAEAGPVGARVVETALLKDRDAVLAELGHATAPLRLTQVGAAPEPAAVRNGERTAAGELVDWEGGRSPGHDRPAAGASVGGRAVLRELEAKHSLVAAALPEAENPVAVSVMAPERPVVLVSRAGKVTRSELRDAIDVCGRMGSPVVGVVLQPPARRRRRVG